MNRKPKIFTDKKECSRYIVYRTLLGEGKMTACWKTFEPVRGQLKTSMTRKQHNIPFKLTLDAD